jgi:hypothetical protein
MVVDKKRFAKYFERSGNSLIEVLSWHLPSGAE